RLIGAFRTCGVLVPVWELARGTEADELTAPVAAFAERLADALATTDQLTAAERGARNGLVSRQVRLR
ncbi:MAG: topoisomerase II, partial [Salana multivorans]|nr:topoisomerase II [Salana multivorans]